MDFVPLEYYYQVHYLTMLFVVILTFVLSQSLKIESRANFDYMNSMGWFYFLFVLIFMGFRPISGYYFGDMRTYSDTFLKYADGAPITNTKDIVFHLFTKASAQIMSVHTYFMLCAVLYMMPLLIVSKKWFKDYWFYGFMFLVTAFSFWAYGTNGIRNGIAGSFFLLAISREKKLWQIVWIILAISFHKSMILPVGAFILANFYNKPRLIIFFWALCIPLSLVGGGFFESLFGNLGFGDERLGYLTKEADAEKFANTGFRWDFLLYSATAVFAGWFYIVKRNYKDKVYFWLFNTYVISNAFWILIIRANFSNRFAYLSWFMIGLVIIYPLLRQFIIPKQYKKIGLIFLAYFAFTLFMNVLKIV